jgi:uncharacterized protein
LTPEQEEAEETWNQRQKEMTPSRADIDKEIAVRRASYGQLLQHRLKDILGSRSSLYSSTDFCDAAGMMLIGMGLVKLGVFSAGRSRRFYLTLAVVGYTIGIPLNSYVELRVMAQGFDPVRTFLIREAPFDAGRLAVALGHVGLVMLLCRQGRLPRVMHWLGCVGRMALTNYLLQSVLCTFVFDGYGLGQFGRLDRAQLLYVVAAVWLIELSLSPLWLRYFRFGPVEWAWRSLTYWQRQPMLNSGRLRPA